MRRSLLCAYRNGLGRSPGISVVEHQWTAGRLTLMTVPTVSNGVDKRLYIGVRPLRVEEGDWFFGEQFVARWHGPAWLERRTGAPEARMFPSRTPTEQNPPGT